MNECWPGSDQDSVVADPGLYLFEFEFYGRQHYYQFI